MIFLESFIGYEGQLFIIGILIGLILGMTLMSWAFFVRELWDQDK